ncbi:hypothetical protein GCM10009846_09760 [Agrococcus versicolor]|uniref:Uncharacterized protein n=1 Tax=Agrococcus versicolor TaxID=501482 RepID=A0ABN3AMG0_9MICO
MTTERSDVSELWFVVPGDITSAFDDLRSYQDFRDRVVENDRVRSRYFAVASDGEWRELVALRSDANVIEVDPARLRALATSAVHQIFRDTAAVSRASAGTHFAHPGGAHTEYFIRASQVFARAQHALFAAAVVIATCPRGGPATWWADTAGILPLLYAVRELRQRLEQSTDEISIDSFGGWDGISGLRTNPGLDVVFISSTTSGGLARELIRDRRSDAARTLNVFVISQTSLKADSGSVLFDLTDRDELPVRSIRNTAVAPFLTFRPGAGGRCDFCERGSGVIELEGDAFFPRTSEMELRVLKLTDRPREAGATSRRFRGEEYFEDLAGSGAIQPAALGKTYDTELSIRHLVDSNHLASLERLREIGAQANEGFGATAVLALPDDSSRALAEVVARHTLPEGSRRSGDLWLSPGCAGESPQDLLSTDRVLLCAGVLSSGRMLHVKNRELRRLAGFEWRFVVGALHPESPQARDILGRTLGVQSSASTSRLSVGWQVTREPRILGSDDSWSVELGLLSEAAELCNPVTDLDLLESLGDRRVDIQARHADSMFAGSRGGSIVDVGPMFALWPFDWNSDRRFGTDLKPSQAEIHATVAHLMAESRLGSGDGTSRAPASFRLHGFALHPAVFDRFNDPMIQASILRGARAGELDFRSSAIASRAMVSLLEHVLRHARDPGGDAAYEFLLSATAGVSHRTVGLRLSDGTLRGLLGRLERDGETSKWPPLMLAMLRLLQQRLT